MRRNVVPLARRGMSSSSSSSSSSSASSSSLLMRPRNAHVLLTLPHHPRTPYAIPRNSIRHISASSPTADQRATPATDDESISLTFVKRNGENKVVKCKVGDNLLRVAQANDMELEGACEGSVSCSTCHVVLDEKTYKSLPDASEDEEDMLDMAFGLTETSRLGCQVKLTRDMDGARVEIPKATRNFYVDGHVPKPH